MEFGRHNEGRGFMELLNQLSITTTCTVQPVSSNGATDKVRDSSVKSEGGVGGRLFSTT